MSPDCICIMKMFGSDIKVLIMQLLMAHGSVCAVIPFEIENSDETKRHEHNLSVT